MLGYLSIGREHKARRQRTVRIYSWTAAAASIVAVLAIGLSLLFRPAQRADERCVSYAYGVQSNDSEAIMASVASSLSDFFAGDTPAEVQLLEMFQR